MFLQQTAAGGLCALFLLLLQRIFRNLLSPRWQYGIWGVLVLRLLIPAGVWGRSTVLDVWPWLEAARAGTELTLDSAYSSPWTLSLPRGPIPLLPAEAPRSLTDWLFLLYLAGALGLALWYLGCALLLSLRVSRGVPVEGPRRAAIDAVAQRYQLPRPRRVVECRWERSPFLTGFLAPALVLPMGWEPDEKVILHELLHLKHRDLWAGWLTAALRCLHWCDPLLWLVFDKVDNDREALCDQRVLERLEGEDRRDYGRVLLSMADSRTVRVPGATTMANGARAIQARIQAIARFKRFPRGMALVSGCMGAALVMALAVGGPAPGGETDPVTVSPQGCGVPGIMASRTIEQDRDRKMTIMTTCFIPCGAKMPIIGLFAGALFGGSGLVAVSAYFIGVAAIVISGIMLKKTKPFAGEPAPFVMELPAYHVPSAKNVLHATWERGWSFIKRAGTIILASSVVLWFLQGFGFTDGSFGMVEDNNTSLLASIGGAVAFLFAPLGFGTWQATVATVTGLIAKENVVSTFGVLFGLGADLTEEDPGLLAAVGTHFTALSAYSFMIFNLLCAPCFAAMGAIKREMNNARWTLGAIGYMCGFAYVVSLIVYQLGGLITGEVSFGIGTIAAAAALVGLVYLLVRRNKYDENTLSISAVAAAAK